MWQSNDVHIASVGIIEWRFYELIVQVVAKFSVIQARSDATDAACMCAQSPLWMGGSGGWNELVSPRANQDHTMRHPLDLNSKNALLPYKLQPWNWSYPHPLKYTKKKCDSMVFSMPNSLAMLAVGSGVLSVFRRAAIQASFRLLNLSPYFPLPLRDMEPLSLPG